jgi:hypothetical protein
MLLPFVDGYYLPVLHDTFVMPIHNAILCEKEEVNIHQK